MSQSLLRPLSSIKLRGILSTALLFVAPLCAPGTPLARAQAPASTSQRGTVKSIDASNLTLSTDDGKAVVIAVSANTRVLQIAPGSTDLKSALAIQLTDVMAGDRVLVTSKAAETPGSVTASRVILMKSTDIAQRHAAEQADWQKRGTGGLVTSVDPANGALFLTNGTRKADVATSSTTIFRRYAGDSVRFEDAQPGTLAQIQPGDQVRVRGAKSSDGASILAEEIVSGSFRNIAGTVASIDASGSSVTIKDLATKKNVVVKLTANSDFRRLPPEAAARFAARARGNQSATSPGGAGPANPAESPTRPAGPGRESGSGPGTAGPGATGPGAAGGPGGTRTAGADLSQLITRLPHGALTDLKPGDAVMIVASQAQPTAAAVTAVTMLSGVEPILAATPSSAPAITISPFSFGGAAPEGGGGAQ